MTILERFFDNFLSAASFMPHGYCLIWRPDIVAMHVGSDIIIAAAYFTIPVGIYYFIHKRKDLQYKWIGHLFAAFITWCGITHVMGALTLWYPYYGIEGLTKVVTAIVSVFTACVIWPALPKVLALPSPRNLQEANDRLEDEIAVRRKAEKGLREARDQLEIRVSERTRELEETNARLQREISAKETVQGELRAHARKLEARNEELDAFAYSASHDLKEPLRGISNYASFALEDHEGALPEDVVKRLTDISGMAEHLNEMVDALHGYARVGREDFSEERLSLDRVVDGIQASLKLFLEETGAQITVDTDMPLLNADRSRLEQLFRNLVVNGIKYNRADRREIHIGSYRDRRDMPSYVVSCIPPGACGTVFYVRDNGVGVPVSLKEKAFRVFGRLHGERDFARGSGIGLSVTKKIVERYGGVIWIADPPEGGSAFCFTLPNSEAAHAGAQ